MHSVWRTGQAPERSIHCLGEDPQARNPTRLSQAAECSVLRRTPEFLTFKSAPLQSCLSHSIAPLICTGQNRSHPQFLPPLPHLTFSRSHHSHPERSLESALSRPHPWPPPLWAAGMGSSLLTALPASSLSPSNPFSIQHRCESTHIAQ